MEFEYIQTPEHKFVDLIYSYKELFKNPKQRFKVKVGGLDFICENCPKYKNQTCNPNNPKLMVGAAFLITPKKRLTDSQVIKKYGLEEDEIYTTKELREKLKF